ncbi:MAG: TrkH family potassium uptake protein [Muribaculaceae bacterium]|nr:TrkH family potassium uptake protein [Muribaculaceae bacterium]
MNHSLQRINFPMVARMIGWLLLIEAVFMCVPTLTALLCHEAAAIRAFGLPAALTATVGAICVKFIRPARTDMGKREGFLLTALVWVVFSLFGMLPFMLAPSARLNLSQAFFEAMSGFTTTGSSLVADTDSLSCAVNIWHCLSQWIGGLGIIIFTLAVIPMFNTSGGMQMFSAEATGITVDKIRPRISSTAKEMWAIYVALTLLLFILLWIGPMDGFTAVCHAMATMSTGGFTTVNAGVSTWATPYVKIVLTVFMFIGGVNFAIIYRTLRGQFTYVVSNDSLKTFVRIILIGSIVTALCVIASGRVESWQSVTIDPLFQVVSCLTSTGFALPGFTSWGPAAVGIGFLLMFSGGCAGSTSGGAKIDRLVYLFKYLSNQMRLTLRPNAVCPVIINNRVVHSTTVNKVVAFLCIWIIVIVAGCIILSMLGMPLQSAFYCSFSAISNAGFESFAYEYNNVPDAGLWVLSAIMLIGRLEIFTVLILFTRTFWHR